MKNFIQEGEVITITAGATITSGSGVLVGAMVGVAVKDAVSGDSLAVRLKGVFELPKTSGDNIAVGAAVYWNNTAKEITSTSAGNTAAGYAMAAAGAGVTKISVKLLG